MPELQNELESLQRKLAWRLGLQAVLDAILMTAFLIIPLGVIDHHFRPELSLIRYLLSIGFWGGLLTVIAFRLIPIWIRRPKLIDVAFAVEDSLSLEPGQVASLVYFEKKFSRGQLQPVSCDDFRRIKLRSARFCCKLIIVIAFIAAALLLIPSSSLIAMSRIANPKSQAAWPQLTKLILLDQSLEEISPGRILFQYGQENSTFYVVDELGDPPEKILLQVRRGEQPLKVIQLSFIQMDVPSLGVTKVFEFRLVPDSAEDLQFRVVGGDDTAMAWTHLLKELRPAIQSLQCEIIPPAYLGAGSSLVENWSGRMRVPVGSELQFQLQLNRAVSEFRVENDSKQVVFEQLQKSDAIRFSIPNLPASAEQLQYELLVRVSSGTGGDDWLRVKRLLFEPVVDQAPNVKLLKPLTNRSVTVAAVVPIHANAKDDYALKSLRIVIDTEQEFSLDAEIAQAERQAEVTGELTIALTGAKAGDLVELYAAATDFNPEFQATVSDAISLAVVTQEEKLQEISDELKKAVQEISSQIGDMRRIKSVAQNCIAIIEQKNDTEAAREQVEELYDRQKQLVNRLSTSTIRQQIASLADELQINRISNAEIESALTTIENDYYKEIRRRSAQVLKEIELISRLINDVENAPLSAESQRRLRESLQALQAQQAETLDFANRLFNRLRNWIDTTDVELKWNLIRSDLSISLKALKSVLRETFSKSVNELRMQQRRELEAFASQHRELADQVENLQKLLSQNPQKEWQIVEELLVNAKPDQQLQFSANAILENNILKAIGIDQRVSELFSTIDTQRTEQQFKSRAELIEVLKAGQLKFYQLKSEQFDLNEKWRDQERHEEIGDSQTRLASSFNSLYEEVATLGIGKVSELFQSYDKIVKRLLVPPANIDVAYINDSVEQMEMVLNDIEAGFDNALQRLEERDRKQQFDDFVRVVKQQLVAHQEASSAFQALVDLRLNSGRLSRRERRELLEIAGVEKQVSEKLKLFASLFQEGDQIQIVLQSCVRQSLLLAEKFEFGIVTDAEQVAMRTLTRQLVELADAAAQIQSNSDKPMNEMPNALKSRLATLLKLQEDLIREEEIFLLQSDTVQPQENAEFLDRQREIDAQLRELLSEFYSESSTDVP